MSLLDSTPSDGLWLVTHNGHSGTQVDKICNLPENPYDFTSIMCTQDDLCSFIMTYEQEYAKKNKYQPSYSELSRNILLFLAEKSGNRGPVEKPKTNRRIDFNL